MVIDDNINDHQSTDEPAWVKSLVSSLERRRGLSSVLPITQVVEEIVNWVQLASGALAWNRKSNRASLQLELARSIETIRFTLLAEIEVPVAAFQSAFERLTGSSRSILSQPPGVAREYPIWADVQTTGGRLLECLDSDRAVGANWDDLVATAKNLELVGREYRPIAELLFDQLRRRGLASERVFRDIGNAVASGRDSTGFPFGENDIPLVKRIANARAIACTPPAVGPVVVWLGYKGPMISNWSVGRVTFIDAQGAVLNAQPEGRTFEHKAELWELVRHGDLFEIAMTADEVSDVDFLVRVDLGDTTPAGAASRAAEIVDTILNVSIHNSGGIRARLAQHGTLHSGRAESSNFMVSRRESGFPNDRFGAGMTIDAIEKHGPRIAEALAREELPRFLAAALEVQTRADYPFSRSMALRKPSEADISSVIPLGDRVVQHIASFAAMDPEMAFELLGEFWPHARWLTDVRWAAEMCLLSWEPGNELLEELSREWHNPKGPWILFVADRLNALLSLCRIESERAWIARMFRSLSDHSSYCALIDEYGTEGRLLEARRKRVRNALLHGNPVSFVVVESVREYAEFLSGSALEAGLEAFFSSTKPETSLARRTEEFEAMKLGQDAETYWHSRIATESSG